MDKLLTEYTVKRKTNRWPLAFFYNMVDVAALCAYIIYMEHNPRFRSTDKRRKFLKDLAKQLCIPAIESRVTISKVVAKPFVRSSMEIVLGRHIIQPVVRDEPSRDDSGRIPVVGSCTACRQFNQRQRKTRKLCHVCRKPVCNEHSVSKAICETCTQQDN